MIQQQRQQLAGDSSSRTKLEEMCQVLNDLQTLKSSIYAYCDAVCRAAMQGCGADLTKAMSAVSDKVRTLTRHYMPCCLFQASRLTQNGTAP